MQYRLVFLSFLFSLLFVTVFIVKPPQALAGDACSMSPQESRPCDPIKTCPAGVANADSSKNGQGCASGHKYCVWSAGGNYWGDCTIENDNCSSQCSRPAGVSAPDNKTSTTCDDQHYWNSSQCVIKIGSAVDGLGGCCDTNNGCKSGEACNKDNGSCQSNKSCDKIPDQPLAAQPADSSKNPCAGYGTVTKGPDYFCVDKQMIDSYVCSDKTQVNLHTGTCNLKGPCLDHRGIKETIDSYCGMSRMVWKTYRCNDDSVDQEATTESCVFTPPAGAPAADCSSACSFLPLGSSEYQQCVNNACSKAPAPAVPAPTTYYCHGGQKDGQSYEGINASNSCDSSCGMNGGSCSTTPPAGAPTTYTYYCNGGSNNGKIYSTGDTLNSCRSDCQNFGGGRCETTPPPAVSNPAIYYCKGGSNDDFKTNLGMDVCQRDCPGGSCSTTPPAKAEMAVTAPASSSTPTGSIIGPASGTGTVEQPLTFTATVNSASGNLTESNIFVTTANRTLPVGCPKEKVANTYWCNIAKIPFTGAVTSKTYTADWTPQQTGSHTVIVNATSSSGQKCTGNTYNPASGWINCGPDSAISVTISSTPVSSPAPTISPVCRGDFNNDGKLDNSDLEFWYASMAKGSSTTHCSSSGGDKTDLSDFYNWWINKQ